MPAVNATVSCAFPAVTLVMVGAPGTVAAAAGVPFAPVEAVPLPTAFTARSFTVYVVPFVRPVIVIGLVVAAGFTAVHVVPLSLEYS